MRLRVLLGSILLVFVLIGNATAQVLATAETGGKGGQAVFVTANGLFPEGLELFNANLQYSRGLTDRFDLLLIYGNISALGRSQQYVGLGWNASLLKRDRALVDVSFFNIVSVPLNKRSEASTALLTPAVVISRPVNVGGKTLTLYTGLNSVVPIGRVKDKLFTPPETLLNVPIGISTSVSSKWSLYVEYDAGTNLKSIGIGLLRTF